MENEIETKKSKWTLPLGIILILIIILGGLSLWKNNSSKQKQQENMTVRVGVIGHFSGKYAEYGIPMKNSIELAVDSFNKNEDISKKKIELVIEDDNSDSNTATTALNKLINIDNIDYVISAEGSGVASAIAPIAQNSKKILMITLGSAPDITKAGDYIFRSVPSDSYQATKMVDLINNSLKSQKVAGLYINDSYGVGIKDIINSNKVVSNSISEMFESSATDFRTQLLKIKESGADTLIIVAHDEYPLILKQIDELGLNVKIITSETFKDDKILKNSGVHAEGVRATFMSEPKDYVDFNNAYQTKFGEKPSAYGMYAYDGAISLAKAIEKSNDKEDVKNNLLGISFNGASGKTSFSLERERIGSEYSMFIVKNGNFVEEK